MHTQILLHQLAKRHRHARAKPPELTAKRPLRIHSCRVATDLRPLRTATVDAVADKPTAPCRRSGNCATSELDRAVPLGTSSS